LSARDSRSSRLKKTIKRVNLKLEEASIAPISELVSPQSLRRTYASLRYACGDDPVYVIEQSGWADPSFPIRVYANTARRRELLSGAHREAFDAALDWAELGSGTEIDRPKGSTGVDKTTKETAV